MKFNEESTGELKVEKVRKAMEWHVRMANWDNALRYCDGSFDEALELTRAARAEVARFRAIIALLESAEPPAVLPAHLRGSL